jgi:hypothetical protein
LSNHSARLLKERRLERDYGSISLLHGPHTIWGSEGSRTYGLLKPEGFDVIVMEQVIEPMAVDSILVVAKVFGIRAGIDLVKVG